MPEDQSPSPSPSSPPHPLRHFPRRLDQARPRQLRHRPLPLPRSPRHLPRRRFPSHRGRPLLRVVARPGRLGQTLRKLHAPPNSTLPRNPLRRSPRRFNPRRPQLPHPRQTDGPLLRIRRPDHGTHRRSASASRSTKPTASAISKTVTSSASSTETENSLRRLRPQRLPSSPKKTSLRRRQAASSPRNTSTTCVPMERPLHRRPGTNRRPQKAFQTSNCPTTSNPPFRPQRTHHHCRKRKRDQDPPRQHALR